MLRPYRNALKVEIHFSMEITKVLSHYLGQLQQRDSEDAFFSLVEADPSAVPHLQQAALDESDPTLKAKIIEIIWQHRLPETASFLEEMLTDPNDEVWKAALDGLVTLGSRVSIESAMDALSADDKRREWLQEALDQLAGR